MDTPHRRLRSHRADRRRRATPSPGDIGGRWLQPSPFGTDDGKDTCPLPCRRRATSGRCHWPMARSLASATCCPRNRSGGVFVEPFPPTGTLYQAPRLSRDFHPVWSREGAELFYVGTIASGQGAAVPVTNRSGVTFGPLATFPFVASVRTSAAKRQSRSCTCPQLFRCARGWSYCQW